jgi:hypothetical protein
MRACSVLALVLLPATLFAQDPYTLFHDDFDVPEAYAWEQGPLWDYMPSDSMQEYDYQTSAGVSSDILTSPVIEVPSGTQALEISIPMYVRTHCSNSIGAGSFFTRQIVYVSDGGDTWDQVWHTCDYGSGYTWGVEWEYTVTTYIPSQYWDPGGSLWLRFYGEVASTGSGGDFVREIDWRLDSVTLNAYGLAGLEPSTWAGIKASSVSDR